jgi:periplasmic protein TonB
MKIFKVLLFSFLAFGAVESDLFADSSESVGSRKSEDVPRFVLFGTGPMILDLKKPVYSYEARVAGIEGKVFVTVLVDEHGRPSKARILKRVPEDCTAFDAAGIQTAMESRYRSAMQSGKPEKSWMTIPIRFQLTDALTDTNPDATQNNLNNR